MTDRPGRRLLAVRLLGGLALLVSGGTALAQGSGDSPAAPDEVLSVVLATWRAEAFGRLATGAVGWVAGCDGAVRLDLAVDTQPTAAQPTAAPSGTIPGSLPDPWSGLLAREGRGWTLVAPPAAEGLYGAWDREWSVPPPGLAALARGVTYWADESHAAGGGASFVLAAAATEASARGLDAGMPGLRRELAGRARGGGGPGERVHVGPHAGGGVEVRSSRRPGRLVVTPREERPTSATPEEVFLPWWSLGEILDLPPSEESGTSGGQAR